MFVIALLSVWSSAVFRERPSTGFRNLVARN